MLVACVNPDLENYPIGEYRKQVHLPPRWSTELSLFHKPVADRFSPISGRSSYAGYCIFMVDTTRSQRLKPAVLLQFEIRARVSDLVRGHCIYSGPKSENVPSEYVTSIPQGQ